MPSGAKAGGGGIVTQTASARLPTTPIWPDVVPADATDYAAIRLMALRKRGSGINLRNRPPTTARCNRILKLLGLTASKHGAWCGMPMKEWIRTNPSFSEADWAQIVAENFDTIQEPA